MESTSSILSLTIGSFTEFEKRQKSDSSSTKQAAKQLSVSKTVSRRQIQGLQDKIQEQLAKNERRYQKIIALNPYHSMKLFIPSPVSSVQYNSSTLQLLMRQMDQLLEDGHVLDKDISKLELRRGVKDEHDSSQHYMFLRKIWNNGYQTTFQDSAEDHLQQLNKKVAMIKNNIYSMIDQEKTVYQSKWHNNETNYGVILSKINEEVRNTQEYMRLKEECQSYRMENEDLSRKNQQLLIELKKYQMKQEEDKGKLSKDNNDLRKNLKEIKEKIFFFESKELKLQEKIRSLFDELKEKEKEIQALKLKQNSASSPFVNKIELKESNTYQNLKFCKIPSFQLPSPSDLVIERTPAKQERQNLQILAKQNSHQIQLLTERLPVKKQDHASSCQSFLSSARNIADLKMNRFVRMRSPNYERAPRNNAGEQEEEDKRAELTEFSTREAVQSRLSPRKIAQIDQ